MAYMNGNEVFFSSSVNISGGGVKEYGNSIIYNIGDIVKYDGLLYTPKANGTQGILPTVQEAWEELTSGKANVADVVSKADKTEVEIALAEKADKTEVEAVNKRVDKVEGMLIDYIGDKTEAYIKNVPANAKSKAMLNRVGGKTVVRNISKNICTKAVEGGIPFETDSNFQFSFRYKLPKGTYWINYSYVLDSEAQLAYDYNSFNYPLESCWTNPVTLESEEYFWVDLGFSDSVKGKFYPMIVEYTKDTEEPTEYEPYKPVFAPTKVTEIVSRSSNLMPTPYKSQWQGRDVIKKEGYKKTTNGISWKINSYENISANGTAINTSYLTLQYACQLPAGNYVFSGCPVGGGQMKYSIKIMTSGGASYADYGDGVKFRVTDSESIKVFITIWSGITVDNIVFKPRISVLNKHYPIPDDIQNKPGYGEGIGQYHSYIDFDRQKFLSAEMEEVIFDGTESWGKSLDNVAFQKYYPDIKPYLQYEDYFKKPVALCTHFDVLSEDEWYDGKRGMFYQYGYVYIRCPEYNTIDDFEDFLKAQYDTGAPLTICVPTRTFGEHDISETLKNDEHFGKFSNYTLIDVAQNGEVIAENENKNPVPWLVTFAEV